jgi:hypothetical protein
MEQSMVDEKRRKRSNQPEIWRKLDVSVKGAKKMRHEKLLRQNGKFAAI